ncbi:glucose 1-dehydrogenase [Pontibacter cellulosilyticus]|uniref:L-rhamnose 1-dehydrogenase (NAD(P)(+)) n=1 Tax=Pontibacter cellulosilyticus TaxID=1720253 RepID=A0A923N1S0_9BACT|nr:glucose 1-dehydrogenase [Pontibacter cellulosilyticus]MBC5991260.1 glucose 1-dehydrogenase [Pontibacter cellulosilyticus]
MSKLENKRLKGKVAVVTGASSGIGQGIAIAMGKAGANVVINYHSDEEGAKETLRQIEKAGSKGVILQADVAKPQDAQLLIDTALENFSKLDILVNNAGIQQDQDFLEMSLEEWQKVMDTNLTGHFLCAQAAAKEFVKRKVKPDERTSVGNIVFISSVHDIIPWAGRANYTSAKAGLQMLMKTLAQELGKYKIRVNAISPGAIKTSINQEVWQTKEGREKMLKQIPYGRIGEPEDIAKVATWLVTDEADYITGTTIYVDGGMTLYPSFDE